MKIEKKVFKDIVEEEKWLSEQEGVLLKTNREKFYFDLSEDTYNYEYALLEDMKANTYLDSLKDKTIDIAYSKGEWVLFKKKKSDGPIRVYASIDEKKEAYKKQYKRLRTCMYLFLVTGFMFLITSFFSVKMFIASAVCFHLGSLSFYSISLRRKKDIAALEKVVNY